MTAHWVCAAMLVAGGAASAQTRDAGSPVTFATHISPILQRHCAECHRPDGDAPFSLATFADVRPRASQIAAVTRSRYMPPWKPEPGYGRFDGERRLSDAEIDVIAQWVAAGAPQGAASASGPAGRSGWPHGEPDLVVTLPEYTLPADGADRFRNFVVAIPGQGTRYVRGLQFRARTTAIHHANIRIDRTPASRGLETADPAPGYEGLILRSADYPDGHFLGWTPGHAPPPGPADLAWRLDEGTDFVVQLHMRATGKPERVQPAIGLYFAERPPGRLPAIFRLGRQTLDIPPGAEAHRVTDSYVLPVAVDVRAVQPHAHYRAKEVSVRATLPDGSERWLLRIVRWDFNWQDQYRYAEPVALPAGTRIHAEYVFDNSGRNPRNPDHPPVRVSWGWRTTDEMGDVWIQVMTRSEADRARLIGDVRRKMAAEDASGCEVLLTREPNHVALRNDAATIYLELGQPERALAHFEAVTRLQPLSAVAHYNEGVALEALGRGAEALARYQRALSLKPDYSAAHNNAGNLLLARGRPGDALQHYSQAVDLDPANAEAHGNLATVLLGLGRSRDAVPHMREAVRLRPDGVAFLNGLAWMLAASPEVRSPGEAIEAAERAAALTEPRARTLDVLAAAYASAGRYEEAVRHATSALTLARTSGAGSLAVEIASRLELYRRGQPFVFR